MNYWLLVLRDTCTVVFYTLIVVGCILAPFVLYREWRESKGGIIERFRNDQMSSDDPDYLGPDEW